MDGRRRCEPLSGRQCGAQPRPCVQVPVREEQKDVLGMGDFNCDLLEPHSSATVKELLTITEEFNLNQLISNPSRVTNCSASLIDILFNPNPIAFSSVGTAFVTGSDHHMIHGDPML